MFKILDITKDNLIAFQVKGKVEKSDYDKLNPILEKTGREFDTRKLYVEIIEIEGIDPAALWEDFKVYFKHIKNFNRVAIVGSGKMVETLSKLSKPFISGEIKFFNHSETLIARDWITEPV